MSRRTKRLWMAAAVAAAVAISFLGGAAADRAFRAGRAPGDPPVQGEGPNFSLIRQAWDIINLEYVDRSAVSSKPLTTGAITGMVDSLGDTGHSAYLTRSMVEEERSLMSGEYVGVGLEITEKNDHVVIVAPLDGSPAIRAGLRAGEQILKVNGRGVADLDIGQVVDLIVGPAGSIVVLSIFDPATSSTVEVPLRRAHIRIDNVSWQPVPGMPFADLRVAAFGAGVAKEVRSALQQIEAAKLKGILLDLRNNPGGELVEAVAVASQFLSGGDVLLEKDAKGGISHDAVRQRGPATALPLVVLINEGTASGAEIVAGALQDARRAPLLGETTFGTGTVLENFPLSDGSAVLLAVREWLTPAGRTIWHKGIIPDTRVLLSADAALVTPDTLKGMTREELAATTDAQVKKALEALRAEVASPSALPHH